MNTRRARRVGTCWLLHWLLHRPVHWALPFVQNRMQQEAAGAWGVDSQPALVTRGECDGGDCAHDNAVGDTGGEGGAGYPRLASEST